MSDFLEFFEKESKGNSEPTSLFIISPPKVGKTELATHLPNSFLIDLEGGSEAYKARKINIVKKALEDKKSKLETLSWVIKELRALPVDKLPDYLIVDTTTALEEIAEELAVKDYKASPMGKGFTGTDITNLPNGGGYGLLRTAFKTIYSNLRPCCNKAIVFLGHVKSASINKNGQDLNAKDVALTGKIKLLFTADMDANAYLYRKGGSNENYLSFVTNEQDLFTGTRADYLAGREFLISEKKDGKLTTHWDKIFPSIKEKVKVK